MPATTEIPILPEGAIAFTEPAEARKKPPTDVAIGFTKGMWAVVVEGVIITRTSEEETARDFAKRVKAGEVRLPKKFPKEWGKYAPRDTTAEEEDDES